MTIILPVINLLIVLAYDQICFIGNVYVSIGFSRIKNVYLVYVWLKCLSLLNILCIVYLNQGLHYCYCNNVSVITDPEMM